MRKFSDNLANTKKRKMSEDFSVSSDSSSESEY